MTTGNTSWLVYLVMYIWIWPLGSCEKKRMHFCHNQTVDFVFCFCHNQSHQDCLRTCVSTPTSVTKYPLKEIKYNNREGVRLQTRFSSPAEVLPAQSSFWKEGFTSHLSYCVPDKEWRIRPHGIVANWVGDEVSQAVFHAGKTFGKRWCDSIPAKCLTPL